MKIQKLKKMLGYMITGALVIGAMGGCGKQPEQSTSQSETSSAATQTQSVVESSTTQEEEIKTGYPIEGDVTLSFGMVTEELVTANAENLLKTPFGEEWLKATGVTLDLITVADASAMTLLIASGELPDVIYFDFSKYPGGIAAAIADGIVEPITDYLDYAPEFQALLESNESYKKAVTSLEGEIVGMPRILDPGMRASMGLFCRQDWLNDLGMEVPETAEELYNVLKAFKEEKGAKYPLTFISDYTMSTVRNGIVTSAFGLPRAEFYQEDGKIHFGAAEKEYKDVLTWMKKLYDEELLDPNFQTLDKNAVTANLSNGVSGVVIGAGSMLQSVMKSMIQTAPEYELTGFGPLVAKEGELPMYTQWKDIVTNVYGVITTSCKNKEAAVRLLNYGYTEEGSMLMRWGIEGVSYEIVDGGLIKLTDHVKKHPDGLSVTAARALYDRSSTGFPYVQDSSKSVPSDDPATVKQKAAITKWSTARADEYYIPTLWHSDEESAEISSLTADINTYVEEMTIKYITGTVSLDTFETEYLPTLEKMKLNRVIDLKQKALDVVNAL